MISPEEEAQSKDKNISSESNNRGSTPASKKGNDYSFMGVVDHNRAGPNSGKSICKWCGRRKRWMYGICKCLKCTKYFQGCPLFCQRGPYKKMFKRCKKAKYPAKGSGNGNYAKRMGDYLFLKKY